MNHELDKIRVIDSTKLDNEFYFESLLEQAHSKGLLSNGDIERVQLECLTLLAYKTERYNGGDSSSIQVKIAQGIMTSILFTIGLWLKTYPNPDAAVTALQQGTIDEIYQKGRKRIDTLIATTKTIHARLYHQLINTQNVFYHDTLVNGILGFFKLYDPDYAAQEIHITADYPLCNPMPKLAGIAFIKAYVTAAFQENQFCSYFSTDDIHHLLCGYAEDYQGLLINVYELVLTAAIGCVIVGVDCSRLDLTEAGISFLCQTFEEQSKPDILATITKAANDLNQRFQFSQELTNYLQNSLPLIANNITVAARGQTLKRIFFVPAFPENKPKIIFSYGEKMNDEQYRKVIEEIGQCRNSTDKLMIIHEHIHSLADLEDALLDADLTGDEIQAVLCELGLPEIAALSKKYQPISENTAFELREKEQLLRMSLHRFISALPQRHQDSIDKTSKAMQ